MNAATYRRNITKSKAGHYRLTLIDRATGLKVTSVYGWCSADRATAEDEAQLAARLAARSARFARRNTAFKPFKRGGHCAAPDRENGK